jgi:hypothetical protein
MVRMTGLVLWELLRSLNGFGPSVLNVNLMFLASSLNSFRNLALKCFHACHQRSVTACHRPSCVLSMHARTSTWHPLGSRIEHVGDRSRADTTLLAYDFSSACNPLLPRPQEIGSTSWPSSSSSALSRVPRHPSLRDNQHSSCSDSRHNADSSASSHTCLDIEYSG